MEPIADLIDGDAGRSCLDRQLSQKAYLDLRWSSWEDSARHKEQDPRENRRPLVAVYKRMIANEAVKESRRFVQIRGVNRFMTVLGAMKPGLVKPPVPKAPGDEAPE